MSTHEVKIERILSVEEHPNADDLSVVVFTGGYQVVMRKDDASVGKRAILVEPDYVVPGIGRVRPKKIRGVWSEALALDPETFGVSPDTKGNLMGTLGITRYNERVRIVGRCVPSPARLKHLRKYDIEPLRKFPLAFDVAEVVVATEKLNGNNARFWYDRDRKVLNVGSRTRWLTPMASPKWSPGSDDDVKTCWHTAVEERPWIFDACREFPDHVIYGEVFGPGVQDVDYGLTKPDFRIFDMWCINGRRFVDQATLDAIFDRDVLVPKLWVGAFPGVSEMTDMAERCLGIGGDLTEGMVLRPLHEGYYDGLRKVFKIVRNAFLNRS